ncbi:MAG: helicase-associated domain-containing protein [Treponema sp.]|nr:helicase-associated domain-containing protein [Treponema sp.]
MKNKIFRSVEFWKSSLMTMPDKSFFELIRSVLGKIKTPFKKQQLINDLEKFLLRKDIQKTMAVYIDQNDAKVISATALFGEPAPGELESFFSGEFSYAQLQDIIVNLEERFILYRFAEKDIVRLALNPLLKQILAPFTEDTSSLFPPVRIDGLVPSAPKAVLDDRILAALLSFVSQEELFFRSEGVIRKHVVSKGKARFDKMDLHFTIGGLQTLGLFYAEENKLLPDMKKFEEFGSLSARERGEYFASALITYGEIKLSEQLIHPLFRGRVREIVNFIHGFLDSLDAKQSYHKKTLTKLAEILKARAGIVIDGNLTDALEKTGLLVSISSDIKQLGLTVRNTAEKRDDPVIAVDSGFSVIVYPEISYADAIKLAAFMNVLSADAVVSFELTKESAVRAFNNNISADEIIELLKRLSGDRIDDSLIWNLKDWEKRYSEVSLKSGVILSLSEDRRYLTKTMPLSELIIETIAPGIYLLKKDAMDSAEKALSSAGIDIISRRKEKAAPVASTKKLNRSFPPPNGDFQNKLKITEMSDVPSSDNAVLSEDQAQERSALTGNFRAILKKMPFSELEREELAARIDRQLVLCEAQLKEASIRYEKLAARNMDYAGKQNIAKQAIAQQSSVEIVWHGEERIFGIPKALEKKKGDYVLVIAPAGGQDELSIPLGKISLLRRIKKSIFEI